VSRRTAWVTGFLSVTLLAVGMELWAAWDNSPDTVPWTDLIAENVPKPLTMWVVGLLVAWLPAHFVWAYRHQAAGGGGVVTKYAKGIVAGLTAGLEVAQATLPLSPQQHNYVAIALAVLGAVAVVWVPNAPAGSKP
jgi:uncharacterized membrane protein YeaQ/YmgE (transglycosylase-associated protein family)